MDFSTGNSGNQLKEAVIKQGPGCRQEGAFCQHLGPEIAPTVYALLDDGYVMEALRPAIQTPSLLRYIEDNLEMQVWSRPAIPITVDDSWQSKLEKFGVKVPSYPVVGDSCLAHGDPTASNTLRRGKILLMADPRPPRDFVPQCRETDMGRILQSYMGWEIAAYGWPPMLYKDPWFMSDKHLNRAATFWCGAAVARIEHLERSRANRKRILDWCKCVRKVCGV